MMKKLEKYRMKIFKEVKPFIEFFYQFH